MNTVALLASLAALESAPVRDSSQIQQVQHDLVVAYYQKDPRKNRDALASAVGTVEYHGGYSVLPQFYPGRKAHAALCAELGI